MTRLVLASASPRRRELLTLISPAFDCCPVPIDETPWVSESPLDYVKRMAHEKAVGCAEVAAVVLAADTTVVLNDEILGKPRDRAHARAMLNSLSGTRHWVYTAIAVRAEQIVSSAVVETCVEFDAIREPLIDQYLDTNEPWDKAGAYGIQGLAGNFVRRIEGSYSAVVGLPLCETREMLAEFGVPVHWSTERNG